MNPPDRWQAWEAPSHTYSNWTFIPTTTTCMVKRGKKNDVEKYDEILTQSDFSTFKVKTKSR